MPPRNPASGKQSAEARYSGYTRNGKRVRGHTRSLTRQAQITRSKEVWIGLGFSTLSGIAIVLEAGVTLVSTVAWLAIALLTAGALVAKAVADSNKKKVGSSRTTRKRRTGTARTRTTRKRGTRR